MTHATRTLALLLVVLLTSACADFDIEDAGQGTLEYHLETFQTRGEQYATEMQYQLALHTPARPRTEKAREVGKKAISDLTYAKRVASILCRNYPQPRCNKKLRELTTNLNTLRTTYNNLP